MILELKNIDKYYGTNHVVKNLNLSIQEGEFLTLLGPSGCGKTTILRMIGGFEMPTSGSISLLGNDITNLPPYKRSVNTVFQNYALFPNMTVEQNIAFGLKQKNIASADINRKVGEMLEMIQLQAFGKRKPYELSGGQQQRVAIARAIANDPDVLLLDEPLGALDLKLRKQMQMELKSLHKELKKTFVYVTHDQEEALTMSDRIAVMNGGILEQISSGEELYNHPKTKFIADFIGEANFLKGKIQADGKAILIENQLVPLANHHTPNSGQEVSLFIRPENMVLNKNEGKLQMHITEILFVGNKRRYLLSTDAGQQVKVEESTLIENQYHINQKIFIDFDTSKTKIF